MHKVRRMSLYNNKKHLLEIHFILVFFFPKNTFKQGRIKVKHFWEMNFNNLILIIAKFNIV